MFWGKENYIKIRENLQSVYLIMNKASELNKEQCEKIDELAFNVLCHIDKSKNVDEELIKETVCSNMNYENVSKDIFTNYIAEESSTEKFEDYVGFMFGLFQQTIQEEV